MVVCGNARKLDDMKELIMGWYKMVDRYNSPTGKWKADFVLGGKFITSNWYVL